MFLTGLRELSLPSLSLTLMRRGAGVRATYGDSLSSSPRKYRKSLLKLIDVSISSCFEGEYEMKSLVWLHEMQVSPNPFNGVLLSRNSLMILDAPSSVSLVDDTILTSSTIALSLLSLFLISFDSRNSLMIF